MIEYGNARVAALRARLLLPVDMRRLEEAQSAAEMLGLLERADDWRAVTRDVGSLAANPAAMIEAAIERYRATRLAALPAFYVGGTARLVEALVLTLDVERVLAILRRRWAGEGAEAIGATLVGGALLTIADLGRLARAPGLPEIMTRVGRLGILLPADAARLAAALRSDAAHEVVEARLVDAADRSRAERAAGNDTDAKTVRQIIGDERAVRNAARAELAAGDVAGAALVERAGTFARLASLERASRRDPLGIGVVAGYVAAVDLQAMRVRAALARVVAGWSDELLAHLNGAAA